MAKSPHFLLNLLLGLPAAALHTPPPSITPADWRFQQDMLQGVSRTFALTIPQLPAELALVVGNAYLLCRIADTVEDTPSLDVAAKDAFAQHWIAVVEGHAPAEAFSRELARLLDTRTPADEQRLIAGADAVMRVTRTFSPAQQAALARCIRIMAQGMAEFQRSASLSGLPDMAALDRYCYVVAGVVGEMLTELFCLQIPALAVRREPLTALAVSFGQGLQMTNILKDAWEDRQRGVCWLPQDRLAAHGVDWMNPDASQFSAALEELLGHTRGHLDAAMRYIELIPLTEPGIRKFCAWAVGMAVLTLRNLHQRQGYRAGYEVKISRRHVYQTVWLTGRLIHHPRALRWLFEFFTRALPPIPRE